MNKIDGPSGNQGNFPTEQSSKVRPTSPPAKPASDKSSSIEVAHTLLSNPKKLQPSSNTSNKLKVRIGAIEAALPKDALKKMGSTFGKLIDDADAEGGGINSVKVNSLSIGQKRNHAYDKAIVDYLVAYSEYLESESSEKIPPEAKITKENALYFHQLADCLDIKELKKQTTKNIIKNVVLKNTILYRLKHLSLKSFIKTLQNIFKAPSSRPSFEMIIERCIKNNMMPIVLDDGSLAIEVKGRCGELGKKNLKMLNDLIPISKLIFNNFVYGEKSLKNFSEVLPKISGLTIKNEGWFPALFVMPATWEQHVTEFDCKNVFFGTPILVGDPNYIVNGGLSKGSRHFKIHVLNLSQAKKIKLENCETTGVYAPQAEDVHLEGLIHREWLRFKDTFLPKAKNISIIPSDNG